MNTDGVIIGAGPYRLSLAAHLNVRGVNNFRLFGIPVYTWLWQMRRGMRLKSEYFASSLYDPEDRFPLAVYCSEGGLPYADMGLTFPLRPPTRPKLERRNALSYLQGFKIARKRTCPRRRAPEILAGAELYVPAGYALVTEGAGRKWRSRVRCPCHS